MKSTLWNFLESLKGQDDITEIVINSPDMVFIEKLGKFSQINQTFSLADIQLFISEVAKWNHKVMSANNPILDGSLPGGARINVVLPPIGREYPAISIRQYNSKFVNLSGSQAAFKLTDQAIQFLKALVHSKMNILISGGTGCGKTTILNLLLAETHRDERIITIEDTFELKVANKNLVQLITQEAVLEGSGPSFGLKELVKNALRMRPDRMIIGEIRGDEVQHLMQAMNTGHQGSMCTIHANGAQEAIRRIESLFMMSNKEMPLKAIRQQIAMAIHFVIQIQKNRQGERTVDKVAEVTGMEGDQVLMQDIMMMQNNQIHFTGIVPKTMNALTRVGLAKDFFRCTLN